MKHFSRITPGPRHCDALTRVLAYAEDIEMRDYRAALARWKRELAAHMARKPKKPTPLASEGDGV